MNIKFILSVIAVFLVAMIIGFFVHGVLLAGDYEALGPLMRAPDDYQEHFAWMILAHAILAVGITGLYRKGHEPGKPWLWQGVRFGFWLALASPIATYLIYYSVQPVPGALVVMQIVCDSIGAVLIGITAAAVNN